MIATLLLLAEMTPVPPPQATAIRVANAPVIDGRLDDPAWTGAIPVNAFWQKAPREGAPPSERTVFRITYDDEALYIGLDCRQTHAGAVGRLTRRDRRIESDRVTVSLDSRDDRQTAFVFEVNAAGALLDGLRFNDSEFTTDWDENWDGRVNADADGWTAELRIPFRIFRFSSAAKQSWGLQVSRYIAEKQETDEWALISRAAGGEVSHYGRLEGIRDLGGQRHLELRPFVNGGFRRLAATAVSFPTTGDTTVAVDLPRERRWSATAGLDLKAHLARNLTLDLTVNPDFGQVEADQIVLNLSRYEVFYPEKRPFFLEGADLFAATTGEPLVYTRRIGRVGNLPAILPDEQPRDLPQPARIWGAAKLTGPIAPGWDVGLISALTDENTIPVRQIDGTVINRSNAPLSVWNALRVRRGTGDRTSIGLTATSVIRGERTAAWPEDPTMVGQHLCPVTSPSARSSVLVPAGARCFDDAYTLGGDWRWRSPSGAWAAKAGVSLSSLVNGPSRRFGDGTEVRPGTVGASGNAYFGKEGGEHWIADAWGGAAGRSYDNNDFGFQDRGNVYWFGAEAEYRTLTPWRQFLETHSHVELSGAGTMTGLRQKRGPRVSFSAKLANLWNVSVEAHASQSWFDDREMGTGVAMERPAVFLGGDLQISSDPSRRLRFTLRLQPEWMTGGAQNGTASLDLVLHLHPRCDLELVPAGTYTRGEIRFVGPGANAGQYLFAPLSATSVGATARLTYTFMPRLSLQVYAQVFLAAGHYGNALSASLPAAAPGQIVRRSDLTAGGIPVGNPDFAQAALDANVLLLWEWSLGSTLYIVYTRSQLPNLVLGPGEVGRLDLGSLRRSPVSDALILKLSYWWG